MAKESDSFAKNLAISVITGLFTIGAEVAAAYLVPQVQNPIIVNNNVVISTDDYEKAEDRIQELEEELNELRPVNSIRQKQHWKQCCFWRIEPSIIER